MDEIQAWLVLLADGKLGWYVSVLTPPIPQWVPYVAGGETPTQLKSAKKLNQASATSEFLKI